MTGPISYPCWGEARQLYLRDRSHHLLGPVQPADRHHDVGFTVTYLPNGEIVVTLTAGCDLNTVHDLCQLISDACLDGDEEITFTRDQTEAVTRIRAFHEPPREPERRAM